MCVRIIVYRVQLSHTTRHRTFLMIFPFILQTVVIARMIRTFCDHDSWLWRPVQGRFTC